MRRPEVCSRGDNDGTGLDEEGPQRLLEGGNWTVGVGEGRLEMREDLCGRPARGCRRQFGWRALPGQCRADLALAQVESFPDALPGPVAEMAVGGANGCTDGPGGGALQELPQSTGCQAEASDFVGEPNAERPPATWACVAVAAKDAACAHRLSLRAAVVKAAEKAVPNERADHVAMRARRLLELFGQRGPFLGAAVKPALLDHSDKTFAKGVILSAWGRGGVVAGYDSRSWSGIEAEDCLVPEREGVAEFSV